MTSGVLPFVALTILNIMIYRGLQAVQRNLNRHTRLANACEQRLNNNFTGVNNSGNNNLNTMTADLEMEEDDDRDPSNPQGNLKEYYMQAMKRKA